MRPHIRKNKLPTDRRDCSSRLTRPLPDEEWGNDTLLANWARGLLSKKPFQLVAVALANEIARIVSRCKGGAAIRI